MRHQPYIHMPLPVDLSLDSGRMVTEYQARFFAHSSIAVQKMRKPPENYQSLEGKMKNMTPLRSDFIPHDVTRMDPVVTKAHHVPSEGSVTHTSTYVHDYKAYSIQQDIVTKTREHSAPSAKLDIRATYKEGFRSLDTSLQQPVRINSNVKMSHKKFDKTVQFQHCCPKATAAATKSWKVAPAGETAPPFESVTSYTLHYTCHPPQSKRLTQPLVYKPSISPLSCVTTYRHDYRCLQVDLAKPIRSTATWESKPTYQGCTKLWDKFKTWPLRQTCGRRSVDDSSHMNEVKFISSTHTDIGVQQCQALPCTHTPRQAWATDKVSSVALSTKKHLSKKVLSITQVKEPDKYVWVSKNTTTCPSRDMPKTLVLPHSFQPNHRSVAGKMASTACDNTKEVQPCSGRVYRAARHDGNKLQRTPLVREGSAAHVEETKSNKAKCSHSPKTTQTARSAVLPEKRRQTRL